MRELIFWAFSIAAVSWVYHVVIRETFLSGWFLWGYNNLRDKKWAYVIYWVIFNCEKCFAGQLALWAPFFWDERPTIPEWTAFIAFSILFVTIITKWTNSEH